MTSAAQAQSFTSLGGLNSSSIYSEARGVSSDGSVVAGTSTNGSGDTEAFIARVSALGSGAITLTDVQTSLAATNRGGNMALANAKTLIHGAHSNPLMRRVGQGRNAFWLAGDWSTDNHGARSGDLSLAEAGIGRNFGAVQINAALGQTWAKQTLALSGHRKIGGTYLLADALIPVAGKLWATVGGYAHRGEATQRRGYLTPGCRTLPPAHRTSIPGACAPASTGTTLLRRLARPSRPMLTCLTA